MKMEHKQRVSAEILRVASSNPEFRKALVGELKTADVEAVRNTAFNIARRLKGQVKTMPVDRIPSLRNYRNPKLVLDPAAEFVYVVKNIDAKWEWDNSHIVRDPQEVVEEEVDGTYSVMFVTCLTKAGGHPAMEFELSEEGKLPWQGGGLDADYRVRRWQDKEIADWIKESFEGDLESDFWASQEQDEAAYEAGMEDAWEARREDDRYEERYASRSAAVRVPKITMDEKPYFRGPGLQAYRAMVSGDHPKWGHLANAIKSFEKYEAIRQKPGWEDKEQLNILQNGLAKLRGYMRLLYPTGKPKKVRKKTPRMMFLEMMVEPEIKSLISKFSRIFKGKPAEAAQFAYDVLEDANFHRDGRNMNVAMAHFSGTTRIAPSSVAQKLGWDSAVLPFAVGIVSGAGDKRGAAQMLKAFVQNNKEWLTPAD